MSFQRFQGQIPEVQGRIAVLDTRGENPTINNNARSQSEPVDYELLCVDQKLYSISAIISEARAALHASRSKIASSTKWYEQKLHAWHQAYEDLKAQHEAATSKLKEDYCSMSRQLEIARDAIRNREWEMDRSKTEHQKVLKEVLHRAEIAEERLFGLESEKASWIRDHRAEVATAAGLGVIPPPGEGNSDGIQDYPEVKSREQSGQELDNRQNSETREFVQISNSPRIISAPISRKRASSKSEQGKDMQTRKRKCETRREKEGEKEIDNGTIIVKMGEGSG